MNALQLVSMRSFFFLFPKALSFSGRPVSLRSFPFTPSIFELWVRYSTFLVPKKPDIETAVAGLVPLF